MSTGQAVFLACVILLLGLALSGCAHRPNPGVAPTPGVAVENLTWMEAEKILTPETVVVIPLGAQSKEHGPHLPLNNDWIMAEYLKSRVIAAEKVVVFPTVNYHYYPAFVEYPGSVTLHPQTACDTVVEIARSISRHGPKRFYVINTGVSTIRPLRVSAQILEREGILLTFTEWHDHLKPVIDRLSEEEGGSHADEIETSIMLYIAPHLVDMSEAVKDYNPDRPGPLTRDPKGKGTYSPTGIWGDPTLATREKGRAFTEALVEGILKDIRALRSAPLPAKQH
ncbi:MAG TPA: creatininase family protein [Candidatus Obscuribacterales bacterium]